MSDGEFLKISPAALNLLMRELRSVDRNLLIGPAMICAEVWNSAGMHIDREKMDGMCALDFLPELPEETARREAEEEAARNAPIDPQAFAAFKAGLLSIGKKKN
jgi:hypothetical protein